MLRIYAVIPQLERQISCSEVNRFVRRGRHAGDAVVRQPEKRGRENNKNGGCANPIGSNHGRDCSDSMLPR
jgi:hypothetical protein